ncbi:glycoside hydrolase family 16 protein, partial [Aureobasidium melanogenum]
MSKFDHNVETQLQGHAPHGQTPTGSKLNPLHWSRNWQIIGAVGIIAIIVAVVVGAVVGTENSSSSSYPDYTPLNYTINERMNGTTFFDHFDYFDKADPSSGNVVYLSSAQAAYSNLTYAGENSAILRVDDTSTGITDRNSIRITSKNQWNSGLFVFDVIHSPYGCGTWPAVWLSDPNNWPEHGEIDVIEAVEQGNKGNQMTLHTSKGCTMKTKRKETGTVTGTNCWNSTNDNEGCGVFGPKSSYGAALNEAGGALFAMELRDAGIRMWTFSRSDPPSDLLSTNDSSPDPSQWGTPVADFPSTDCDISSHFKNQSIIANIDLCGSWAGSTSVYSTEYGCPGTCADLVKNNATAFENAYWEFASFRVWTAS